MTVKVIQIVLRGRLPKIHKVNLAQEIEFAQNPSTIISK